MKSLAHGKLNSEIFTVLDQIARLSNNDFSVGITVNYIESKINLNQPDRLVSLLDALANGGYIRIRKPNPRVQLVHLTAKGYEKVESWRQSESKYSPRTRLRTVVVVIATSLFVTLLGFGWWWLGLTPDTTDLQPLSAQIPIRVYHAGIVPPNEPSVNAYYAFPNAPAPGITIQAYTLEESDAVLQSLIPEYIPVTRDGWVTITLDVENVVSNYQVNIDTVKIEVERTDVQKIENVYYVPPGLGGGAAREYELILANETGQIDYTGVEVYETQLKINGDTVDYIFVLPGDREKLDVSIQLDIPGNYVLTPLIEYSFRENTNVVRAQTYPILYPRHYQLWMWDQEGGSCQNQECVGGGEKLITNSIVMDTQNPTITLLNPSKLLSKPCFQSKTWIAFESSMATFGYLNRLFTIRTDGTGLRMASDKNLHNVERNLAWLENGLLFVSDPDSYWDQHQNQFDLNEYVFDPLSGDVSIEPPTVITFSSLLSGTASCTEDQKACVYAERNDDTNGDGLIDSDDLRQIYWRQNEQTRRLGFSTIEEQYEPIVSVDGHMIAFIQGTGLGGGCSVDDVQNIYVMQNNGAGVRKITNEPGYYRDLSLSPDGRFIAFLSARSTNNPDGLVCYGSHFDVFVIDLVNGEEVQLTQGSRLGADPRWSIDNWMLIGGDRLTITSTDGNCSQDIFIPPVGDVSNILLQP